MNENPIDFSAMADLVKSLDLGNYKTEPQPPSRRRFRMKKVKGMSKMDRLIADASRRKTT